MKNKFNHTQQELLATLKTLRLLVKEVGGNYIAGLQSEVSRIHEAIRLASEVDEPHSKKLIRLEKMLDIAAHIDIKPQKGRRRDLKELDRVISQLSDSIDKWS